MALSLTSPIGSDFLKDFPGIHRVNSDQIDNYAGPCLPGTPLQSFTPALTATTTAPTLGVGGVIRGFYYEIFDQIYTWGEFRFGTSGIAVGSGTYCINLPFTVSSVIAPSVVLGSAPVLGNGATFDASSIFGSLPLSVHLRTSSQIFFGIKINAGTGNRELRESGYVTWAINDGVSWSARFQRSP
jgi:hypothetical protein